MKMKLKKAMGWCMALCVMGVWAAPFSRDLYTLPESVHLDPGESYALELNFPLRVQVTDDDVAQVQTDIPTEGSFSLGKTLLTGSGQGNTTLQFTVLGIPLRSIEVSVEEERMIIPGGQSIGVTLDARGVLVVSCAEVVDEQGLSHDPAGKAGIKRGEIITAVDGTAVKNARHLTELVNESEDDILLLTVENQDQVRTVSIEAIKDRQDGVKRLGLWVRDSTAGIGTLSFIDPETKAFGALGHSIADPDTGKILPVEDGDIYRSRIVSVQKGSLGSPGELRGSFSNETEALGKITQNQKRGIYGYMHDIPEDAQDALPAAGEDEVHLGDAQILSTVDEEGMKSYDVKIIRIYPNRAATDKGIVIQITDEELLEKTGGIVQGMSGSPIIQDGKLVGAVTHVLVNDPTRGYGIFIENMLEAAG